MAGTCQLQLSHVHALTLATDFSNAGDLRMYRLNSDVDVEPPPLRPAPHPRYDGSFDDWDVDVFTPPPPREPSARKRIEAKLKEIGITFDCSCSSFEEVWVEFGFPDGTIISMDDWGIE